MRKSKRLMMPGSGSNHQTKSVGARENVLSRPSSQRKIAWAPTAAEHQTLMSRRKRPLSAWASALLSALILIFAFPNFDLWPLAWVALVPALVATLRGETPRRAFLLWWSFGTVFFYGSCWWLTHAMTHYGGIPAWIAFLLLVPGALVLGLFPAAAGASLAWSCRRHGTKGLIFFPFAWTALEMVRLYVTGQLWNAIGYSQSYVPTLIQPARWGGVYAVGFMIVACNASLAALIARPRRATLIASASALALIAVVILASRPPKENRVEEVAAQLIAVQPNVPVDFRRTLDETQMLVQRHVQLSLQGLQQTDGEDDSLRVVVWPESPMNFRYARDASFRQFLAEFARTQHVAVLFNAMEPAPAGGIYNSALLVDERGEPVAQYDKIRLLPFGEYVPLPRWLPGASFVSAVVGDFTPGARYTLMPIGRARAGVFICFESAFPSIARAFASQGADVLINISNDGYLGATPVLRQHLANAIMRAVETGRPVLRVTNSGISARISARGEVIEQTPSFQATVRVWPVEKVVTAPTFYAAHGDLFAVTCLLVGLAPLLSERARRLFQRAGKD